VMYVFTIHYSIVSFISILVLLLLKSEQNTNLSALHHRLVHSTMCILRENDFMVTTVYPLVNCEDSYYAEVQLSLNKKQKLPLYRNISKNNKNVQSTQHSRQMSI
jgi:hypothetical protein